MSRTNSASSSSNAQVSDETTQMSLPLALDLPSASGRNPIGSRTATSEFSVRNTSEYAPRTWRSASAARSGSVCSRERAMR